MATDKIHTYSRALQAALGAVRTTHHAGYGLAPLHPTQAMTEAGAAAVGVSFAQAQAIYVAMLAAQDETALGDAAAALYGEQENIPH